MCGISLMPEFMRLKSYFIFFFSVKLIHTDSFFSLCVFFLASLLFLSYSFCLWGDLPLSFCNSPSLSLSFFVSVLPYLSVSNPHLPFFLLLHLSVMSGLPHTWPGLQDVPYLSIVQLAPVIGQDWAEQVLPAPALLMTAGSGRANPAHHITRFENRADWEIEERRRRWKTRRKGKAKVGGERKTKGKSLRKGGKERGWRRWEEDDKRKES